MTNGTNYTAEQLEALMQFVTDIDRDLAASGEYIANLEQLKKERKLPTNYVAFEILEYISGGLENGYSPEKLLAQLPDELSKNVIPVPAPVIGALLNGWLNYKNSEIHDMDHSFGLIGQETRRPPVSNMKQVSKELNLVKQVVGIIYSANLDGEDITLSKAMSQLSESEEIDVSYETIRKAWYKHRERINNDLVSKGLPSILV